MPKSTKPIATEQRADLFRVDSRLLVVDESYIERERFGDIPGFAASIRALGLQYLPPLLVYRKEGKYVIIRGHRRHKAIQLMEQEGEILMINVIIEPSVSSGRAIARSIERRYLEQATENEGLAYTPWEKAKVLGKMVKAYGWKDEQLAEETGWSLVYVRSLLALYEAPQKLINLIRSGRISGTFAMDMISEGRVQEVLDRAEKGNWPAPGREMELFEGKMDTRPAKVEKLTRSDLKPNSWKVFRKWAPKVAEEEIAPEKAEVFYFLQKMIKGEVTETDLKNFFAKQ